jgi:hypothetical protein
MDGYTVSVLFLELLYQQARLDYLMRAIWFLWFFEKHTLLICELWEKPLAFERLAIRVFLRMSGMLEASRVTLSE